ncbi:hypothetical protein GGF46_005185 [Coemansia sp. RSA 552]|nr:hypothetical protein GGF46_005185 [Coemansia sp. RSA 552]
MSRRVIFTPKAEPVVRHARGRGRGGGGVARRGIRVTKLEPQGTEGEKAVGKTQTAIKCVAGKDGSRLLTLGTYQVSFTNQQGVQSEPKAGPGFQSAKVVLKTGTGFQSTKIIKAGPPTVSVTSVTSDVMPDVMPGAMELNEPGQQDPGRERMELDATQERISKLDIERPLLIVAGAGSGKTSTLCARVVEMVRQGVPAQRVLVITFTNKAATELKERIARYMRVAGLNGAAVPRASTFHSWCFGLVQRFHGRLGWDRCPMVAATEGEHRKVLGIALEQIEDSRRLVQCEEVLGLDPPELGDPDRERSLFVADAAERWQRVVAVAAERTGFVAEQPAAMAAAAPRTAAAGKKQRVAELAAAVDVRVGLMQAVYGHVFVALGRARGLPNLLDNALDFGAAFPGRDTRAAAMGFVYRAKACGDASTAFPQVERSVLEAYNGTLRRFGLADFDDLLLMAREILRDESTLREVRAEWPYLLVDEFQDFNHLQTDLVLRLQDGVGRVTAVGDERQSIYAFRGAACEHNFSVFLSRFVDAQVARASGAGGGGGTMESLTRNYRSHQSIVDLGNIVARDTAGASELLRRLRVPLQAQESVPVVPVAVWQEATLESEARAIARRAREILDAGECAASDIAVLSRCLTFGQYRPTGLIEQELLRCGIPYVVRGGSSALKSRRMQMLMALIRTVANPADDVAAEYCLVELASKVGPKSLQAIRARAHTRMASLGLFELAEAASNDAASGGLTKPARAGLRALVGDVRRWQRAADEEPLRDLIRDMYRSYIIYVAEDGPAAVDRAGDKAGEDEDPVYALAMAVIDSLAASAEMLPPGVDASAINSAAGGMALLQAFSAHLCMLSTSGEDRGKLRQPAGPRPKYEGAVVVTTVHQAKGLEWMHVFIPQFNENLFPMGFRGPPVADAARAKLDSAARASLAHASEQHYREEGRLAYVAITRAKRGLYISVPQRYAQAARWLEKLAGPCVPSRYLPDIMYSSGKGSKRRRQDY